MRIALKQLASAITLGSSQTIGPQQVDFAFGFSVQANILTGSPVGTIKLQSSVDGSTYVDYPGSSFAVSGTGSFIWNVTEVMFSNFQVVYTRTSGTGTMDVFMRYKGN